MKRVLTVLLALLLVLLAASCGKKTDDETFTPALDTETACKISVVGSYDNFEALEAEFDRFNEYYPNVELSYTKIDDYNNAIATVLSGNDAPNVFFSFKIKRKWQGREKWSVTAVTQGNPVSTGKILP